MIQYFIFVWNPADRRADDRVRRLSCEGFNAVFRRPGVVALSTAGDPAEDQCCAAVFGTLFDRRYSPAIVNERTASEVARTRGKFLADSYWGNYVAVWRDPISAAVSVMRGPASTMPCF